ncbi:hypothetical protein CHS0354_015589 [Potamilus streckersoni]|uniref:Uncharacterized protein n=1 Tax=Potamilus streckersoni TaxID=2493646 RepID=A0AAE0TBR3_9BIVA|nr:hypothetical protein CHS0354_015589 [Potamilus streckersoni]
MLILSFLPLSALWTLAHGQNRGVQSGKQDIGVFRNKLIGANATALSIIDPMSPMLGLTQCPRLNCTGQPNANWTCSITQVFRLHHNPGYCRGCRIDLCRVGPGSDRPQRRLFRRLVCRELSICGLGRKGGILDGSQGGINITVADGVGAGRETDIFLEGIGGLLEPEIVVGSIDRAGNSIILGPANI